MPILIHNKQKNPLDNVLGDEFLLYYNMNTYITIK